MKFVTYNIQFSRGCDGVYSLVRIAEAVGGADVIALQEVERNWERSGLVDQPAELARLLPGYHWVYGAPYDLDASQRRPDGTIDNRRRQFGNMLLSKTPFLSSRHHLLPKFAVPDRISMQRGALEGVIETAAGLLRVYSLHLGHNMAEERLAQIAELLAVHGRAPDDGWAWSGHDPTRAPEWLQSGPAPAMPVAAVFMGDFNLRPGSPEYQALTGAESGLADSWVATGHEASGGMTCPSDLEDPTFIPGRLDYGFVTAELKHRLRDCWIDEAAEGSDHQPVWIETDL